MKFIKLLFGGTVLTVGWMMLKDRTSRPCHNCGASGFLTGLLCAECRQPTCPTHMGIAVVCGDCIKKLSDEVKTSTTATVPGFSITETVGVVTADAEPTADMAIYVIQMSAKKRGANGVVDLKVDAVTPAKGGLCYIARGTAVKIESPTRSA